MVDSVSQYLLRAIGSKDTLSVERDVETLFKSHHAIDQNELRACISEAVDLLKQQIYDSTAAAFRYRNSLLPIQRLPSELLSTTISHAMAEIECHNYQRLLIQLSAVSSWWRSVTLGTPSLWGVLNSNNPEWIVSLALERSKDAPLTVVYEEPSHTTLPSGACSCRDSIGPEDFFGLVSPHTARWTSASLRQLGSGDTSIQWLDQHKIQLSRHLRQLDLCWNQSPSAEIPVIGFSGLAECLLELTLRNLHVSPASIIRILSASGRITSLNLESLLDSERESEAVPDSNLNDKCPTGIDLPYLTKLHLKSLPPSIFGPVVQNINTSNLEKVSITHHLVAGENPTRSRDPFAPFIARFLATISCVSVHLHSTGITLMPFSKPVCECDIELQGEHSVILPWLRLRTLPQITQAYSLKLIINSGGMGENPEQVVIDNLMRLPRVEYVVLEGSRESWRWVWLLSLPDAVETDPVDSNTTTPKSWLWPDLDHLNLHGDNVNEFTVLSALLVRYGSQPIGRLVMQKGTAPRRLARLEVQPGNNEWRAEVLDRIRELVGPGCFAWKLE